MDYENLTYYQFDQLVGNIGLPKAPVKNETIKNINGINYIEVVETYSNGEKVNYYECNLTRKNSDKEILDWIKQVFADYF